MFDRSKYPMIHGYVGEYPLGPGPVWNITTDVLAIYKISLLQATNKSGSSSIILVVEVYEIQYQLFFLSFGERRKPGCAGCLAIWQVQDYYIQGLRMYVFGPHHLTPLSVSAVFY